MNATLERRTLIKGLGAAGLALPAGRAGAQAAAKLKLGVVLGFTGGYSTIAPELKRGIEIAVDAVNAKGLEVAGKRYQIETQYYDDKTEASTAARFVERAAISDGCHMVLASGGSAIVKANLSVAQRLRFPMVPVWSQVDGVYGAQKGDPWLFSTLAPFSKMYRDITKVVAGLGNPKVVKAAMIAPNDELGQYSGKEYFPEDCKLAGIELLGVEYYPPRTQEYVTALARIRRLNPDYLVINALANDIIGIVKEMQSTNYFPKVVCVEAPASLKEPLGDVLNGMFVPVMWDTTFTMTKDSYIGSSADFSAAYQSRHGKKPDDFVPAIGAHNVITYCEVLAKAGAVDDARKIKVAFQAYEGETFFSSVKFGADGLNQKGPVYPGQFQSREAKIVFPSGLKTADIMHPYPKHTQ